MTADQRQMFQDTLLEDEADLEAQLAALQSALPKDKELPVARVARQSKGLARSSLSMQATGTGSISVPTALSPSRQGFGPPLSMHYDSGT